MYSVACGVAGKRRTMSETSELTGPLIKALNQTGGLALRMPVGKLQKGRHWVQMHEEGTADILFFPRSHAFSVAHGAHPCTPVWIETKDPKGTTAKKRKAKQAEFRAQVENLGHRYVICKSLSQIEEILK